MTGHVGVSPDPEIGSGQLGAESGDVVAAATEALENQRYDHEQQLADLVPALVAEVERLRAVIFAVQEARVDYEAALRNREHGGVAADRFIRAVTAELDFTAGAA